MNRRTTRGPLGANACHALHHAWHKAAKDGYPLNAMVSIRPSGNLSPLQHAELVNRIWNGLGVWSRRHTKGRTFHAILTRETVPSDNWHQAAKDGYPLNVLISIRPAGILTPLQHADLVDKTWNRLGVWSRRHTADHSFHAILVRETVPIDNFHLLLHVDGNANLSLLRYALARWFPEIGEAHVTRAHQHIGYTPTGKIKSALGYVTKERTPQAAWPKWQYRRAGTVFGKRFKITANLRAKPVERATPKPIRIEDCRSADLEAALAKLKTAVTCG